MELSHSEEGDAVAEAAADDTGCGSGVEAPDATDVSEALREGGPGAGCPSLCEVFEGLQGPGYGVARPETRVVRAHWAARDPWNHVVFFRIMSYGTKMNNNIAVVLATWVRAPR